MIKELILAVNLPRGCQREDCFAYMSNYVCTALREIIPENCPFYKTKKEVITDDNGNLYH